MTFNKIMDEPTMSRSEVTPLSTDAKLHCGKMPESVQLKEEIFLLVLGRDNIMSRN